MEIDGRCAVRSSEVVRRPDAFSFSILPAAFVQSDVVVRNMHMNLLELFN